MILRDPGATCRQLGYILPEECPFNQPNTSTAAAAAAAAAAVVACEKGEKESNKVQMEAHSEGVS